MTTVQLTVNGRSVSADVTPRTHLADLLRERFSLTGTHLRCEQGVCGACTLLIDGQPARSCITPALACGGAHVTTIEGLDEDPVATALREAFTTEHGLQCGYCTPGMVISARDIVLRLPQADEQRIRHELSGNLCRCTGYTGIVRAVQRVLEQVNANSLSFAEPENRARLGPVGSGGAVANGQSARSGEPAQAQETQPVREDVLGLDGARPNIEIARSILVKKGLEDVWSFLADVEKVAACMPGARLDTPVADPSHVSGSLAVKLGPIGASFAGEAEIERDATAYRGTIRGAGRDRFSKSRTRAEIEYRLVRDTGTQDFTCIEITLKALLTGALAQISRAGIVDDIASRIIEDFSQNLEDGLAGKQLRGTAGQGPQSLKMGALLLAMARQRLRALMKFVRRKN